jgi:RNA polymerase sigma factor (sigma-70 family)
MHRNCRRSPLYPSATLDFTSINCHIAAKDSCADCDCTSRSKVLDAVASGGRAEAELLQRLQAGDQAAWVELIQGMRPRLLGYLRHNVPTQEDAEDVLGETLIAVVRALKDFDGKATLATFIFSLAYRKIADFWRKRQDTVALVERQRSPLGVSSRAIEFAESAGSVAGAFQASAHSALSRRVERRRNRPGGRSLLQRDRIIAEQGATTTA